jgi:hypothetical protein
MTFVFSTYIQSLSSQIFDLDIEIHLAEVPSLNSDHHCIHSNLRQDRDPPPVSARQIPAKHETLLSLSN